MDPLARARALCEALPEVTCRSNAWADVLKVRNRVVAYVLQVDDARLLVVNADPEEIPFLAAGGHPFFVPGGGARNRIGVVLDDSTDWDEVAELVEESYRRVAPKALLALLPAR